MAIAGSIPFGRFSRVTFELGFAMFALGQTAIDRQTIIDRQTTQAFACAARCYARTWSFAIAATLRRAASLRPVTIAVIIAAMADMVPRTASELRMLQQHLRDEDRHLVLANLVTTQLETMEDAGVLLDFDADDLCGEASTAQQRAQWLLTHRDAWGRQRG